jgi:hypothetical protein
LRVVAPVERERLDQLVFNHLPDGRGLGIQQRLGAVDRHLQVGRASFQCEIEARDLVHIESQLGTDKGSEAVHLHDAAVLAGPQKQDRKVAFFIGNHIARQPGLLVGHVDFRTHHDRARLVGDPTGDLRVLTECGCYGIQCKNKKQHTKEMRVIHIRRVF